VHIVRILNGAFSLLNIE